jgi:hypothetical protein
LRSVITPHRVSDALVFVVGSGGAKNGADSLWNPAAELVAVWRTRTRRRLPLNVATVGAEPALEFRTIKATRLSVANYNTTLSSDWSQIGTDSSNSLRSASESRLYGFSARFGGIAHACGFICVMRGTGENHFPAVRAQTRSKSLLASEAVPSMQGARRDRFDDGLSRNVRNYRERAYEAIPMAFACAVQSSGRSIRSARASAVSSGGWSPAAIASTITGARNASRSNRLM